MLRWLRTVMLSMTLVACGGVPLETSAPRMAAPSPIEPDAVELEPSVFHALLVLDLTTKLSALGDALPKEIDLTHGRSSAPSDEHGALEGWLPMREGVMLRAHIARGPLTTRVHESNLIVESRFEFGMLARVESTKKSLRKKRVELRSCGCAGQAWCGEDDAPPLHAMVRFTTTVELLPSWKLEASVAPELTEVASCKLGKDPQGKPIDASKELQAMIEEQLEEARLAFKRALDESRTLERSVQRIWEILAAPASLERPREKALALTPSAVGIGELFAREETLLVPVRFVLHPAIVDDGPEAEAPPLPHATKIDPELQGVRVAAVHEVALSRASKKLASELVGTRFSKREARYLEIRGASVYGTPDGAAVRLKVVGSASGSLYLRGTLRLDASGRVLFLDDVRFDPDSQRAVDRLYDVAEEPNLSLTRAPWIDASEIVDAVRRAARWPLADSLRVLREDLLRAATRPLMPKTKLDVTLDEGTVISISIDAEAMRALVKFEGELENALRDESN